MNKNARFMVPDLEKAVKNAVGEMKQRYQTIPYFGGPIDFKAPDDPMPAYWRIRPIGDGGRKVVQAFVLAPMGGIRPGVLDSLEERCMRNTADIWFFLSQQSAPNLPMERTLTQDDIDRNEVLGRLDKIRKEIGAEAFYVSTYDDKGVISHCKMNQ